MYGDEPCESLGHFYEDYRCIYCDVEFCDEEHGGHSFYSTFYNIGHSPADCWHCHRRLVNLRKREG